MLSNALGRALVLCEGVRVAVGGRNGDNFVPGIDPEGMALRTVLSVASILRRLEVIASVLARGDCFPRRLSINTH